MDTPKTSKFFVGSIVTFIILFGLIQIILITMLDVGKHSVPPESMANEDIIERIKPVAQVNVGDAPIVDVAAPMAATNTGASGADTVTQVCALCHRAGMMSAPRLGNAKDWAPRIKKGLDTLYSNAINGFNMMPARGSRTSLSDDEVKAAVDHMLSLVQ